MIEVRTELLLHGDSSLVEAPRLRNSTFKAKGNYSSGDGI
jgi:hypothetical protein